jgi:hypothetical protein
MSNGLPLHLGKSAKLANYQYVAGKMPHGKSDTGADHVRDHRLGRRDGFGARRLYGYVPVDVEIGEQALPALSH